MSVAAADTPRPILAGLSPATLAAVVILGLLAIRLAAVLFGRLGLIADEAQYWFWAQDLDWGYFSKPPLIAWSIAATTAVCGDGAGCIRLSAPFYHAITAALTGIAAWQLFRDRRVAATAAVVYATLPGVAFSSLQISTDVPLMTAWATALVASARLIEGRGDRWAVVLGLALAAGLLAKYAMLYFVLGILLFALTSPGSRWLLTSRQLGVALGLAVLGLVPNLIWNLQNDWVTVGHTASNANWGGDLFRPVKGLEFLAGQGGVFGPITLAAYVVWAAATRPWQGQTPQRLLFWLSAPILATVIAQAFLSRAHANWAATAYVAASIAVAWWLVEGRRHALAATAIGLNLAVGLAITLTAATGWQPPREAMDPFMRMRGWPVLAERIETVLSRQRGTVVLADERKLTAQLVYHLRDRAIDVRTWRNSAVPLDHYQMAVPLRQGDAADILFVTAWDDREDILERFATVHARGHVDIPVRDDVSERFYLYHLIGPIPEVGTW